jgi:glutamate decarboxylase
MSTLLQCSTIHFKEDGLLIETNQMCADYLFQQDKHYDVSYDTGDKVIQCGRHNDIFKLWLMWRSKGMEGYERHIDHLFDMTDYMVSQIKRRADKFYLIIPEPECVNVSFWYVPTRLRNVPHSKDREQELGRITPILKARMMDKGSLMIGYQPVGQIPNFFRNIISNPGVQKKDVDYLLDELDRLGHDL